MQNFADSPYVYSHWLVLLELFRGKFFCIYLWVMLKSVSALFILQENHLWKSKNFQNFKGLLFLVLWLYGYHFWLVLKHLIVLSKKGNSASLANIRKSHDNLNVKSNLKLNNFWKLYAWFKDSIRAF